MQLSHLAAKQKRAKDWQQFLDDGETKNPELISQTKSLLAEFRIALAAAAQESDISAASEAKIIDLERRLEQLNEESRCVG